MAFNSSRTNKKPFILSSLIKYKYGLIGSTKIYKYEEYLVIMNKRVVFSKENQKKFIRNLKEKSNLEWKNLAKKLDVNENTLSKAYLFGLSSIPYSLFLRMISLLNEKENNIIKEYNVMIIDEIKIIGRKVMGEQRKKFDKIDIIFNDTNVNLDISKVNYSLVDIKKNIKLPAKLTPELAEEIGIHYGDGFLSVKRYDYRLKGNINDEIEYYKNYIKPLFKKLFNINVNLKKFDSTFGFEISSKALWEFKTKVIGIKPGNKKDLCVPERLKINNQKILCAFIRGLFDTDGSLYFKSRYGYKNYYPTITISLYSKNLIIEMGEILKMLGFNPSIYLNDDYPRISLNGIGSLKRYEKMIGWSSQKNLNKLNDWKNRYSQLNNMADVAQRQCVRLWLARTGFDSQLPLL